MSYTIRNKKNRSNLEVPDGWWVVLDVYYERHYYQNGGRIVASDLCDPEPIGLNGYRVARLRTGESSYPNGGGGQSDTWFEAIACTHPFAVVQCHGVGTNYKHASIKSARQIHNGELGRYPTLPGLPAAVCHHMDNRGKPHEFVRWREVAVAYGDTDLGKLWKMFISFWQSDFQATYETSETTGRVHYPHRIDGPPITYWSEEFRPSFPVERIERYITERGLDAEQADRLRARMSAFRDSARTRHEQWVEDVRQRKVIMGHILWDDPVLQLEHLCVPIAFARSVLSCKKFGYIPDFTKEKKAKACHDAHPAMP